MKTRIARQKWWVQPIPGAREKEVRKDSARSYPEPTQVPLGEKPKVCRDQPKRGKSANWPRNFGIRGACGFAKELQVAVTRGTRLFNKNTASRESERMCTGSESWPVAVR